MLLALLTALLSLHQGGMLCSVLVKPLTRQECSLSGSCHGAVVGHCFRVKNGIHGIVL